MSQTECGLNQLLFSFSDCCCCFLLSIYPFFELNVNIFFFRLTVILFSPYVCRCWRMSTRPYSWRTPVWRRSTGKWNRTINSCWSAGSSNRPRWPTSWTPRMTSSWRKSGSTQTHSVLVLLKEMLNSCVMISSKMITCVVHVLQICYI